VKLLIFIPVVTAKIVQDNNLCGKYIQAQKTLIKKKRLLLGRADVSKQNEKPTLF